ncbi:ribosome maturation factor RimP [Tsukamurella sp. 8F]|uniref:ribosome maturation factor RimP n=1 Tax=unclassified Tsukamurella TaxID=2633480 RepID=UPI0023B8AA87|nr:MULTISPECIES: ribosome maturation factor RimP [unclassified Tsukamurella]MDF0531613.1 ribosome maturation factor RimP [Tsukamurella sp. 8J]MDF0587540.1 ribosome maturation factor RimP [Tsukamurella sp. 8F]
MAFDETAVMRTVTPLVESAGLDLERVRVVKAGPKSMVSVVVDSDAGPSLDEIADLTRDVSAAIDEDPVYGQQAFTLEVTTPGAERPLDAPRHWRRARGRRAAIEFTSGDRLIARIGELAADEATVTVVVPRRKGGPEAREIALADVAKAVVQVEFSRPDSRELELSGLTPGRVTPGAPVDETGTGDGTADSEGDK